LKPNRQDTSNTIEVAQVAVPDKGARSRSRERQNTKAKQTQSSAVNAELRFGIFRPEHLEALVNLERIKSELSAKLGVDADTKGCRESMKVVQAFRRTIGKP